MYFGLRSFQRRKSGEASASFSFPDVSPFQTRHLQLGNGVYVSDLVCCSERYFGFTCVTNCELSDLVARSEELLQWRHVCVSVWRVRTWMGRFCLPAVRMRCDASVGLLPWIGGLNSVGGLLPSSVLAALLRLRGFPFTVHPAKNRPLLVPDRSVGEPLRRTDLRCRKCSQLANWSQ